MRQLVFLLWTILLVIGRLPGEEQRLLTVLPFPVGWESEEQLLDAVGIVEALLRQIVRHESDEIILGAPSDGIIESSLNRTVFRGEDIVITSHEALSVRSDEIRAGAPMMSLPNDALRPIFVWVGSSTDCVQYSVSSDGDDVVFQPHTLRTIYAIADGESSIPPPDFEISQWVLIIGEVFDYVYSPVNDFLVDTMTIVERGMLLGYLDHANGRAPQLSIAFGSYDAIEPFFLFVESADNVRSCFPTAPSRKGP